MKTLPILAALLISASVSISAHAEQPQGSYIADTGSVTQGTNNALRLKFMSRRGFRNSAVHNKNEYKANDAWVGATYIDERENKASKRLNRQFRSKRGYTNYQFD